MSNEQKDMDQLISSGQQDHAARGGRRAKKKFAPPLTPMIDVTFLLLIYFLITSAFRPDEGQIPGSLPQMNRFCNEVLENPIRITLIPRNGGVVYEVRGRRHEAPEALYLHLKQLRENQERYRVRTPLVIVPSGSLPWKYTTEAYNQACRAKYKLIGFASGT